MNMYKERKSSNLIHLESQLSALGYQKSLNALNTLLEHMNTEKGLVKNYDSNYYVDVAQALLNYGTKDDEIIAASLLRDFIEDVDWATHEYVKENYGERVFNIIVLSKEKTDNNVKNNMDNYLSKIEGW